MPIHSIHHGASGFRPAVAVSVFRRIIPALLVLGTAVMASAAAKSPVNVSRGRLALDGYDAVAYWTGGRPLKGSPELAHRWNGAVWRFASAEHRDRFAKEPQRYAPQFGGYCAYAVSKGYTANGDPRVWRIVDGRLYLNYSVEVQTLWSRDVTASIAKGHANWPSVLER